MTAQTVDAYLANLVDVVEGGTYTNDPADKGGPTRWGITQATLAKWRGKLVTALDVQNLTRDEALAIYRSEYVTGPGFDKVYQVAPAVALEMIDTGVNMGQQQAARYLQRCLRVTGAAIVVDGNCGPKTVQALRDFVAKRGARGVQTLVTALNCLQGGDYIRIAEANPAQEKFVYGWLNQRVYQNVADWACRA